MLLVDAGKVVTGTSGTTIDNIRSGLLTELESGVQKPMAEWQGTYAAVKQDAKALAKLANSYGKCEHAMIAAQGVFIVVVGTCGCGISFMLVHLDSTMKIIMKMKHTCSTLRQV